MSFRHVPKADLHVHLEGTIAPATVLKLAERNKVPVPQELLTADKKSYQWQDDGSAASSLKGFIQAYDDATSVMKSARDYTDITYDYLSHVASEGCIYSEITISSDHAHQVGITYAEMLAAITEGAERAKAESGIEARLIATCVRHYGPEAAVKSGQETRDYPHPLVTGFGMAGDENAYTVADFKPAYDISGLSRKTAHAGEAAGPESVRAARDVLGVRRFGHMVRASEDKALMEELKKIRAVPEVCVSSNRVLKVYKDYKSHPLRYFFDQGLNVTLGSDDPTFFSTSIGREYQIAEEEFGFSEAELKQLTRNAITEAFIDDALRHRLMAKLAA